MKKLWTIVLIAMFIFSLTASAFAAQTFSDVPAKHWTYEAVAKLAKAGLIEGYGDGTFRGDKPMNRYEFATLTVRLLDRFDRADEAQKQLIDKLSAEFAAELNRMGARVAKLEAKTNTWVAGGDARFRYMTNNPQYLGSTKLRGSDATDWRARIRFTGNINDNIVMQGRISTNWGNKFGNTEAVSQPFGSTAMFDIFNLTAKNTLGLDSIRLGRTPLDVIGYGLLGKPMAVDGVTINETMGKVKFTGFTGNLKGDVNVGTSAGDSGNANQFTSAQLAFKVSDNFKMGVGYFWADIPGTSTGTNTSVTPAVPNTTGFGTILTDVAGTQFDSSKGYDISFNYTMGGLTLMGDYIVSSLANPSANLPGSPKAWSVQLSNGKGPGAKFAYYPTSYQLVRIGKKGDDAWAIGYRSVDPGALPNGATGFDTTAVAYNQACNIFTHGTDNVKVLYLAYQNVIDKNVVLSFEWQDFRIKNHSLVSYTNLPGDKLDSTFMTKLDLYF